MPGASLTLYVGGSVDIGGGGVVNGTGLASDFSLRLDYRELHQHIKYTQALLRSLERSTPLKLSSRLAATRTFSAPPSQNRPPSMVASVFIMMTRLARKAAS